jgi:ribosome biogenesis protein Tsr3
MIEATQVADQAIENQRVTERQVAEAERRDAELERLRRRLLPSLLAANTCAVLFGV